MASTSTSSSRASPSRPSTRALSDAPRIVTYNPPIRRSGGSLKGKERALAEGTYPGPITYRSLLGNGFGGPTSPLRVVAHIDVDCAYASMEIARLKYDPTLPFAVQQWNACLAVNYPSRKWGVKRIDTPAEARRKCPTIKIVHIASYRPGDLIPGDWPDARPETHKISLDYYRRESLKIIAIFKQWCPVVHKASIDESFLDLTLQVRDEMLARWPSLAKLPEGCDMDSLLPSPKELGVEVDWDSVGNLVPVNGQKKGAAQKEVKREGDVKKEELREGMPGPATEGVKIEEPEVIVEDIEPDLTWSDVALSIGADIVNKCRKDVLEQLGYTCSAGIAPNKMLAKLCSAWQKPNAQTILRFCAIPAFLRPLPFRKIRNLGGKFGVSLQDVLKADTVGDLLHFGLRDLQAKVGDDAGIWLWETLRGFDYTEVDMITDTKTMLACKSFIGEVDTYGEMMHWLEMLAVDLHLRLCEARVNSPGLWPKTITFSHRRHPQRDGTPNPYAMHNHQMPFPFNPRFDMAYILKYAERLFRTNVGERLDSVGPDTKVGPYGVISVCFSQLERIEEGQRGLSTFLSPTKRRRKEQEDEDGVLVLSSDDEESETVSFYCSSCSRTITSSVEPIEDVKEEVETARQRLRDEHADFHFARDLLEKERGEDSRRDGVAGRKKVKVKVEVKAGTKSVVERQTRRSGQQTLTSFFK